MLLYGKQLPYSEKLTNIKTPTDLSELLGPPHDGDLKLLEGGADDSPHVVRQDAVLRV